MRTPRLYKRSSGSTRYFYVYKHVDPETEETVYVGMGSCGRAWSVGYNKKDTYNGHRSEGHMAWYESLEEKGYTLWDIVKEHKRNLTREEAFEEETRLIEELLPRFNVPRGKNLLKMNKEKIDKALQMRKSGKPWKNISSELGLSVMTVWRGCNGHTKNLR